MVILADISNEIVLTEKMRSLKIEGQPLEEGIPGKVKRIKGKEGFVYRENEILNIRELRNQVVHLGSIPDKGQAERALEVARDVLEKA